MGNYQYRVYGLRVDSEIEIPELVRDYEGIAQVQIRMGEVPSELHDYNYKGVFYQTKDSDFIFAMDQIGSFRVENGEVITLKPSPIANQGLMRVFLLGSVFGALLHQRGILALHGSAISCGKGALVITGRSSSGKSTLAAALTKRGYPFLTDDISALHPYEGDFYVHPGIPQMKLWRDVINKLEINEGLMQVRPSIEKYKMTIEQGFSQQPEKVNSIIMLGSKNTSGFEVRRLHGFEVFEALKENTYRYEFVNGLQLSNQHFRAISELANSASVFHVQRPSSPLMINELVEVVIEKIINAN